MKAGSGVDFGLYETFHSMFEVVPADTPDRVDASLALRYQVYCLEHGFEDPDEHPGGREQDSYDRRAVHALVRHRDSGAVAGSVRLVLPDPARSHAAFPLEAHCLEALHRPSLRWEIPRTATAEVSRFAVSHEFKRRLWEGRGLSRVGGRAVYGNQEHFPGPAQQHFPHITIGLFAGIVQLSARHHISHWYAAMEPALLRLLTRFGIHFQPVGGMVDYHGRRRPTLGLANEILRRIHRDRPQVWNVITDHGRMWPLPGSKPVAGDREPESGPEVLEASEMRS